jgi:hypothetical protein
MRLETGQLEVLYARRTAVDSVPRAERRTPVSMRPAVWPPCRPPGPYVPGFILPEWFPSSELLHTHVRPRPFGDGLTARVSSLITT